MKFCSSCGSAVSLRVPSGDDRERHVCDDCGTIHYSNPRIVAGCLVTRGPDVLLCRRAIQPRHGFWTLPAGYLENGETTLEGALRETREEARAAVRDPELYTLFNLPHIDQVYLFFRGELDDGGFGPGVESLEVDLFPPERIPWDELAFPVVERTLRFFHRDREHGHFPVRVEDVVRRRR